MAITDRIPYQALFDRPKLTLPGGKKLAFWVILNVEDWRIENSMPRTVLSPPMGQPMLPDVPNWSWHEYGMRAGFWRQLKALTDRNIPITLAINGNVCNSYPQVAEAAVIGVFHPKWDERPLLIVQMKPEQSVTKEDLLQFMDGKIAKWWMPDDVVFVDAIPHTATGKILKTALRDQFKTYSLPTAAA